MSRREPARIPAGPKRAPGRYEVPVSWARMDNNERNYLIYINIDWVRTYEGGTDESNIEGFVAVLAETLDPRQPSKRSDPREDGICGD